MMEDSDSAHSSILPDDPLLNLDRRVILEATEIFQQRFTMFSFYMGPHFSNLFLGKIYWI